MSTPISWTSTGLSWTAADPMWPVELLNPCMIESIKECDAITSRTVPALFSAAYNPIRPNRDYVNAVHSEVSALIPLFVDHLDHSGDWNGQDTIPNFTEATILAAIGDASRIVPSNLNVLSPWYFQTYKILNMMRWRKITPSQTKSERRITSLPAYPILPWADIVADFNSLAWSVISSVNIAQHAAGMDSMDRYSISRYSTEHTYSNATGFDISAQMYALMSKPSATSYVYENNDQAGTVENKLFATESADISNNASHIFSTGHFGNNTASQPTRIDFDITAYGWKADNFQTILKFDGAGGKRFTS